MIGELAGIFACFFNAKLPDHLQLRVARGADGIGDGNHAAEMRLANFRDVMLHYESVADYFDIDRHGSAVICGRSARR